MLFLVFMRKKNTSSAFKSIYKIHKAHIGLWGVLCDGIFLCSVDEQVGYVDTWMMDDASLLHLVV